MVPHGDLSRPRRRYQGWGKFATGLIIVVTLILPWAVGAWTIVSWTVRGAIGG